MEHFPFSEWFLESDDFGTAFIWFYPSIHHKVFQLGWKFIIVQEIRVDFLHLISWDWEQLYVDLNTFSSTKLSNKLIDVILRTWNVQAHLIPVLPFSFPFVVLLYLFYRKKIGMGCYLFCVVVTSNALNSIRISGLGGVFLPMYALLLIHLFCGFYHF